MADDKLVQKVIPARLFEYRQVTEVMLQPSGLRLEMKRNEYLKVCELQIISFSLSRLLKHYKIKLLSHLSSGQNDGAQQRQRPARPPEPHYQPGEGLQQQDVTQVEVEEQRPSLKQTISLCIST